MMLKGPAPRAPSALSAGAVYFVECIDSGGLLYVKIGLSNDPHMRLAELAVGCPLPFTRARYVNVKSYGRARRLEKALHGYFRDFNCRGEWFVFDHGVAGEIEFYTDRLKVFLDMELCRDAWTFTEIGTLT